MKYPIFLLALLLLLSCSGTEKENAAHPETEKDITGVWRQKNSDMNTGPEYRANEWALPEPPFDVFRVTDSTMDFFNYPYEYLFTFYYERNGNEITFPNSKNNFLTYNQIKLVDSMIEFSHKTIYDNNENDWLELIEKYAPDSLDLSVLDLLKKDTINYQLLKGKWELSRSISSDDGSEPMDLVFPLKFPDQFEFPIEQLDTAANKQLVQLKVEGKNRMFRIRMTTRYSFELIPHGWSVDNCPQLRYHGMDE